MKKIILSLVTFICAITVFAGAAKSTTPVQGGDNFSINFNGKKYYLQYSVGDKNQWLNEYLPEGYNFDNYKEMFSVRSYDGETVTTKRIGIDIVAELLKKYPGTYCNLVEGKNPGEVEISFLIMTEDVAEFNLFRITQPKDSNPIALQYVRRTILKNLTDAQEKQALDKISYDLQNDFDKWLKSIQNMPVPKINRTLKR